MGWAARRSGSRAAMLVAVAFLAAVISLLAFLAPPATTHLFKGTSGLPALYDHWVCGLSCSS